LLDNETFPLRYSANVLAGTCILAYDLLWKIYDL
jgi:hypothetical protein